MDFCVTFHTCSTLIIGTIASMRAVPTQHHLTPPVTCYSTEILNRWRWRLIGELKTPHATGSVEFVRFFPTDIGNASQDTYARTSPPTKMLSPSPFVDTLVCIFPSIVTSHADKFQSAKSKFLWQIWCCTIQHLSQAPLQVRSKTPT